MPPAPGLKPPGPTTLEMLPGQVPAAAAAVVPGPPPPQPPNPAAPATAPAPARSFRQDKFENALDFLDQVKIQFARHPRVYNQFLDIMKDFKTQR